MADVLKDGQTGPLQGSGGPFEVECLLGVMEKIRTEVTDAFYAAPRGGVEVGGVLYGAQENVRIVILAARPLGCEHAFGPSFALSASDHGRLAALLEAPRHDRGLAGMHALGWYHSHTRSELELTPQDQEIHDRYFPEPGQAALVLRPASTGPMRTRFYMRGADGGMHSLERYSEPASPPRIPAARPLEAPREPHPELLPPVVTGSGGQAAAVAPALDPPRLQAFKTPLDQLKFLSVDVSPDPPRFRIVEASPEPPRAPVAETPPDPPQAPVAETPQEPPRFAIAAAPKRQRWGLWASLVVVACMLAWGAGYLLSSRGLRTQAPEPPPGLNLQVFDQHGQLEVRWDGTQPAVLGARGGSLEFQDGATRRIVPLDPKLLRSGSVYYARLSDTVRVHLTVELPDGSKLEEPIIFIGQAPPGTPSEPQPEVASQKAGEEAAAAERRRVEKEREDQQRREREKELERQRLAAQKKTQPTPSLSAQARPETVPQTANPPQRPPVTTAAADERPPAPPSPAPAEVKRPATPAAELTSTARPPETAAVKPAPPASQAATQSTPPPPIASPPATQTSKPIPAAKSEPAVVVPSTASAKPPAASFAPLSGQWTLARSVPSGSPFRPDSVTLSLSEDGNWLRGSFAGKYRTSKASGIKPDVNFVFGGPLRGGTVRLAWAAPDGSKGEIEFIRLPNNSESLEVVWYFADRKFVFDDLLVRVKKQ